MEQETKLSLRGRPRDLTKRTAMIDAGRALFAAGGSRHVTVEQVLTRAGISRGTFYAHFADIDSLLEAVMSRESDRILESARVEHPGKQQLPKVLLRFGISLLTLLSDPEMHSFEHRLALEAETRPDLARRFFEAGPARAHASLVGVVVAAIARGELIDCNPQDAVGDLIGLWQGFHRLELLLRVAPTPTAAEIKTRAARGVKLFLRLYGAGS